MKYSSFPTLDEIAEMDTEDFSEQKILEEQSKSSEYATEDDWDEDLKNEEWDDIDKIDHKIADFDVRIAELEEELEHLKTREILSLADSGGLATKQEILEYKLFVLDEQRDILSGHKYFLEGNLGIPNDVVFAELEKKLNDMRLLESAK